MDENKNEIIIFENQNVKLKVNMKDDTVWLTQDQMSELFGKAKSTINEHIHNIYDEHELEKNETMTKFGNSEFAVKPTNYYNLDMIISIGYRVKSQNGIIFRRWATKILKDYMLKGYAINRRRLDYLEKTVKLVDIANRIDETLENEDAKEILKLIGEYSKALDILEAYDKRKIKHTNTIPNKKEIKYENCKEIISNLKYNKQNALFGIERNNGLKSIIGNIYQSFSGQEIYKTLEEKGANLLYLIVKDHPFTDGNKRIAATLFIYFLNFYGILYKNDRPIIDNKTLAALTLLTAESNPNEKEVIVDLIMNFMNE